jgi:hypothetical protein
LSLLELVALRLISGQETVHLNFLKFFSIAGSFRYVDREKVKNFFPLKSRISRILVLSYSKIPQK